MDEQNISNGEQPRTMFSVKMNDGESLEHGAPYAGELNCRKDLPDRPMGMDESQSPDYQLQEDYNLSTEKRTGARMMDRSRSRSRSENRSGYSPHEPSTLKKKKVAI